VEQQAETVPDDLPNLSNYLKSFEAPVLAPFLRVH